MDPRPCIHPCRREVLLLDERIAASKKSKVLDTIYWVAGGVCPGTSFVVRLTSGPLDDR